MLIIMITAILTLLYFLLLVWFITGWRKLPNFNFVASDNAEYKFSIIISARDEAENIENTILDLAMQDYPSTHFEVLIINDSSDDDTLEIAEKLIKERSLQHFSVIDLEESKKIAVGKKVAIGKGVETAKYEWIVSTDADCRRSESWLSCLASFIAGNDVVFVSAPVSFHDEKSLFSKMQTLEFMSLIGIGAASIGHNRPTLCNGANLAYKKEIFKEVEAYADSMHLASGDDEFLLHKVSAKYPGKTGFLKHKQALVFTKAKAGMRDFFNQRKRWVSKSTDYKNWHETLMIWLVWLMHLFLLLNLALSPFDIKYMFTFIISFMIKLLAEFVFIFPLSRFFNKTSFLILYPFTAILYIFYVVIIPFAAVFGSFEWKGRKY